MAICIQFFGDSQELLDLNPLNQYCPAKIACRVRMAASSNRSVKTGRNYQPAAGILQQKRLHRRKLARYLAEQR